MPSHPTSPTLSPEDPLATRLEGGPDEQHKPVGFEQVADGAGEPAAKRSVFKPVGFEQGGDGKGPDDPG